MPFLKRSYQTTEVDFAMILIFDPQEFEMKLQQYFNIKI